VSSVTASALPVPFPRLCRISLGMVGFGPRQTAMRCIEEGTDEIALPWLSGKLCTLGYLSPALTRLLRPAMEKRGARNKRAYIERKRSSR